MQSHDPYLWTYLSWVLISRVYLSLVAAEIVAYAPFSLDVFGFGGIVFNLFTQAPDVDIHGTESPVVLSPTILQEHGAAVDLAGVCRQELRVQFLAC